MSQTTLYALLNAPRVLIDGQPVLSLFTESAEGVERAALEQAGLDPDEQEAVVVVETLNEHGSEVFHRFLSELQVAFDESKTGTAQAYDYLGKADVVITAQAYAPWNPTA